MLLKNLETYENVNRELKDVIYELKAIEKNDYRRNLTNESLIKHIDGLEEENNVKTFYKLKIFSSLNMSFKSI
jgi:hypothetical protein